MRMALKAAVFQQLVPFDKTTWYGTKVPNVHDLATKLFARFAVHSLHCREGLPAGVGDMWDPHLLEKSGHSLVTAQQNPTIGTDNMFSTRQAGHRCYFHEVESCLHGKFRLPVVGNGLQNMAHGPIASSKMYRLLAPISLRGADCRSDFGFSPGPVRWHAVIVATYRSYDHIEQICVACTNWHGIPARLDRKHTVM